MQKNLIAVLAFAIVVAIFSIQNAGPVSLVFFTWQFETSLVVVVLGSAGLGALVMWIISSFKQLKLKKEKRKLNKEKKKLQEENEILLEKNKSLESQNNKLAKTEKNTNKINETNNNENTKQ